MRKILWALVVAALAVPATGTLAQDAAAKAPSPFEQMTKDTKKAEGLFKLYYKDQSLLVEIAPANLGQNYIVLTSIAKGISQGQVLGGMSWGFGDDIIWSFNKVGDKIHVVQRNVKFRATAGSPEASAVKLAYSDSILYALPIMTTTPSGGMLVDMTRIFFSDDQMIGRSIGMSFAADRSTWAKVKAFPDNVELQVAAVYSGLQQFDTVADPRGVQVHVHYSISRLPTSGYTPRVADDRVGYFLTVLKDFSDTKDDEQFIRYINRWNLKKKDPKLKLSPPEKPITFWMEKTVPINLRPYVQAGIEEWNKAYEKLGYSNAIVVLQQPDDADWDPEDVNYNTFRWITANAGFAMGPSRVNPMTGQILDADIIFDADFLTVWKQQYETLTLADAHALFGEPMDDLTEKEEPGKFLFQNPKHRLCQYGQGMQQQMGFAGSVLMGRGDIEAGGKLPEDLVNQGIKEVVMHEVGHTLGLRHNFKASTWKTLAEMEDPAKQNEATVASVMDYSPPNIAPKGKPQALYYTQTIGPYDYWAIEYGYKPLTGDEATELAKIAARSTEPGLEYLTDEDTYGSMSSDPGSNRFDLGKDPIEYAQRQIDTVLDLMPKVVDRAVKEGEGYQRARQMFGMLLSQYWQTVSFVARVPGGIYTYRDHKPSEKDKDKARAPFQLVEEEKQKQAMEFLQKYAFDNQSFPPDVLNYLAASRWSHWGQRDVTRLDYPIHDNVLRMQSMVLRQLMSSSTLGRLRDGEVKVNGDKPVYTLADHIRLLTDSVFSEIRATAKPGEYNNRKPYITSYRRNLQRLAIKQFASLLGPTYEIPEDARTLARMHLTDLEKQIGTLLGAGVNLDDYTKAHLLDSQERIKKALAAQLTVPTVD